MAKPVKSQWDFGELFPVEQTTRKVLSVAELTSQIRRLLEQQVGRIWVTGEITNLRAQTSGHMYFTLKDTNAQLSCVLFRGEMQVDRSLVQDGRKVVLQGEVTVYESRGQYQLRVTAVELQGVGALQVAFEKLKQKLNAEGLFAQERKRPLPRFPQRLGLVTSPTGAAIRDVLHVVKRRNPGLQVILAPCRVQGEGAEFEIAAAIRLLNDFNRAQSEQLGLRNADFESNILTSPLSRSDSQEPAAATRTYLDLILVTRGGGSLEDLWAFNEEMVARAIFHSALPVVSAIGHEIDFTISDFVADVRAATPSAAAEIITEGVFSSCQFISEAGTRMRQLLLQQFSAKDDSLARAAQRLARLHPRRRLQDWLQLLDDFQNSMVRCLKQEVRRLRVSGRNLSDRLSRVRPTHVVKQRRELLRQARQRLLEQAHHRLHLWREQVTTLEGQLRLLAPEQVLARGYSITMDAETGKVLRDTSQIKTNQRLKTRLKAGVLISRVEVKE